MVDRRGVALEYEHFGASLAGGETGAQAPAAPPRRQGHSIRNGHLGGQYAHRVLSCTAFAAKSGIIRLPCVLPQVHRRRPHADSKKRMLPGALSLRTSVGTFLGEGS